MIRFNVSLKTALFAVIGILMTMGSASAQGQGTLEHTEYGPNQVVTYESHSFGYTPDGSYWYTINVQVPSDGWVEIDFNGDPSWLWGADISAQMLDDLLEVIEDVTHAPACHCSLNLRSHCKCNKGCAHDGNYNGTCDKKGH